MYMDTRKKKNPGLPRLHGLLRNKRAQVQANRKQFAPCFFFSFPSFEAFHSFKTLELVAVATALRACQSKSIICMLKCPSKGTSSPVLLATASICRVTFRTFLLYSLHQGCQKGLGAILHFAKQNPEKKKILLQK